MGTQVCSQNNSNISLSANIHILVFILPKSENKETHIWLVKSWIYVLLDSIKRGYYTYHNPIHSHIRKSCPA